MAIETPIPRAPYASDPARSRGRLHPEPVSPARNAFRRDCDRIIHATAFRRLAHKTQVFVFHEGDILLSRATLTTGTPPANNPKPWFQAADHGNRPPGWAIHQYQ